ncbi:MAG TPA: acylneuraminate cytidylyltransferase family protein [Gammaproteobacteria bacterium]|nr:acylneuraminate cytidylyltransferase family protein [Gammaproteobacteria bacterium]
MNAVSKPKAVALVPARAGSRRVVHKNIRCLGHHPLLAYTIQSALQSGVFEAVVVSTDDARYADIARHYGAQAPFLRPADLATATSPDIEWVAHALENLAGDGHHYDCFSILRPTSPFRTADTLRRAWRAFAGDPRADSLRAVEPCRQHPGKMWLLRGSRMQPLLPFANGTQPWHSSQYPSLPEVYVQNASLEIAWTRVVLEQGSIAGSAVVPFLTQGREGFDINSEDDWMLAEVLLDSGAAVLPKVDLPPYGGTGRHAVGQGGTW